MQALQHGRYGAPLTGVNNMDITEKFEDRDTLLHFFIIASLTGIEITDEIKENPMLVTMQINGQDVNPVNSIERLEQQFDRMVKDTACEMLEELKYKINQKVNLDIDALLDEVKAESD